MANKLKGEVALTLQDGREFTLVLDMNALIEAETAYGKPMKVMMREAAAEFFGAIRAVLYGALRTHHPAISLQDAGSLMVTDLEKVHAALEEAGDLGFAPASEGEGKQGGKPSWEDLWRQWCEAGLDPEAFFKATPRTYGLIVGARIKAAADQSLSTGWHSEAFARTKRLPKLDTLLRPLRPAMRRGRAVPVM